MSVVQARPAPRASAEQHMKAAECCIEAATEHACAAKAYTAGNHAAAKEHAKKAEDHCAEAWDYGQKAKAA